MGFINHITRAYFNRRSVEVKSGNHVENPADLRGVILRKKFFYNVMGMLRGGGICIFSAGARRNLVIKSIKSSFYFVINNYCVMKAVEENLVLASGQPIKMHGILLGIPVLANFNSWK